MHLSDRLCPWLASHLAHLEQAVQADRLGHGWIFAGPAGTGKLNLALVFAARLLDPRRKREQPAELAPGELVTALEERHVPRDHHPDLHLIWPDEGKRTIGIDRVREVIERISLTGYTSQSKVVVLEPAEWMTMQAANALLKSLEEPSSGTHLILVSHCVGRLPATIRSRCQTLYIRRPAIVEQQRWLGAGTLGHENPLLTGEGVGPVHAAERLLKENINDYKIIDSFIDAIYDDISAVDNAVDAWRDLDTGLVLEWLSERIRDVIRARTGARNRNPFTDRDGALPHNRWAQTSTARLFTVLEQTEQLRDLLGTGLNEELALKGILGGFSRT